MASAASSEPADGELIKQCSFSKGEWALEYPVDVGFDNIYQLFETPVNVGFDSLSARGLLAVAYAAGEHEQLLLSGPECFLAAWESKAEARSVRPPETGAAATNAYNTAMAATDSYAARVAVKIVKATQGTMSLIGSVRNLPMVNGARLSLAAFPRLQKITPRSTIQTSRLRELAARVGVVLPDDLDTTEDAREKWVWSLPMLTRSITTKAIGFLAMAYASTPEAWSDAVAALGADGRFRVDYMAEKRRQLRESRAAAAAGPAAGKFDPTVTPIAAWNHVAADIADADVAERVAKALANATTGFHQITVVSAGFEVRKIAVGTAVLSAMKARDQALAAVPKMPATEDVALQTLLGYLYLSQDRPVATPTGPPEGAAPAAGATGAGTTMMVLSPETIAALRPAQTETTPSLTGSDKIVLGKAPTTDGTLKRPEYFAAGDVGDFQRHEASLMALEATDKNLDNKEFLRMYRALPETARSLVEVPVYPADLARNHCLNVLTALADRISAAGDDLIRQGTILSKYRESDLQRQQDRERAKSIAKLRQGDLISAGPQICVVDYSLATAYDFLQIPYLSGKVASAINGDWDSTWYLWAEVAESQLGKECDIAAGVEQIVKTIRQDARKGDDPWSDQQRADYGAVALFYFTRDYRRWREKWPGAERPSLLRVMTSVEFSKYIMRAFDYANKPEMRPSHEPYDRVTLGKAPIKRKYEAITAAQLFADESDEDDDSTSAAPPLSRRAKERERKKKKAAGDKPSATKGGGAAGDARKRRDDKGAGGGGGDSPGGGDGPGGGGNRKGDKSPKTQNAEAWVNVEGGGSAWPDMNHRLDNDQCAVLQAKLDVSDGIDKGSCACFFFGKTGCAKDKRAGVIGKCGWSHGAPQDRKDLFCRALCKTANMPPPMRLKNQRVWTDTPSGHKVKTQRAPSPAPSNDDEGKDDDGDA